MRFIESVAVLYFPEWQWERDGDVAGFTRDKFLLKAYRVEAELEAGESRKEGIVLACNAEKLVQLLDTPLPRRTGLVILVLSEMLGHSAAIYPGAVYPFWHPSTYRDDTGNLWLVPEEMS